MIQELDCSGFLRHVMDDVSTFFLHGLIKTFPVKAVSSNSCLKLSLPVLASSIFLNCYLISASCLL